MKKTQTIRDLIDAYNKPGFDHRKINVPARTFDAAEWLKWGTKLGLSIYLYGASLFVSNRLPNGGLGNASLALMAALNSADDKGVKVRKVKAFLEALAPGALKGAALEKKALRKIADIADQLPLVQIAVFSEGKIPLFASDEDEISNSRPAEWVEKTRQSLRDKKAAWEEGLRTASPEKRRAMNRVFSSYQRARRMESEGGALMRESYSAQLSWFKSQAEPPRIRARPRKTSATTQLAA